jgi:hypothetical protein
MSKNQENMLDYQFAALSAFRGSHEVPAQEASEMQTGAHFRLQSKPRLADLLLMTFSSEKTQAQQSRAREYEG